MLLGFSRIFVFLNFFVGKFCALSQADEVVLFEKQTFLVISHATHVQHQDVHRYEKIRYPLSCASQSQFTIISVVTLSSNSNLAVAKRTNVPVF
jgi:hypothetical protein